MIRFQFLIAFFLLVISVEAMEFPYEPPKNFSLFIEKGLVLHPVTTKIPEAQRYFDQGLTFLYAFNHDAAFWSFKRASEIDPDMAMAYWGMALVLGDNINMKTPPEQVKKAYQISQKALELSSNVTENEKAYIKALALRYSDNPKADNKEFAKHYHEAMGKVVEQFPDDLDAATLYAESGMDLNPWGQWDPEGNPREGTLEIVEVLESVLKRNPDHLGANHYYIHAVEASKHPERALVSAQKMQQLLPQSGHILHMPAHIYLLVGDYHKAAVANEEAVAADRTYIRKFGIYGIYPLHYQTHNLYFLSRAYSMEGRLDDSLRVGKELYDFYAPHFKMMPELEYYLPAALFTLLRFHQWDQVLETKPFNQEMKMSNALLHYARGISFANLGDLKNAQIEQKLFEDYALKASKDEKFGYNQAHLIYSLADLTLKSAIAIQQNNVTEATQFLKEAIKIQDNLQYNEPPDWFFSIRESLGGIYLRNNQNAEAEKVFRDDLERHPRNGRSLFGLLESLKRQKKLTDAYWVQTEFDRAWRYSGIQLTIDDL